MNLASVLSKNGVLIRLTDERWKHICLMHPNLANKQAKILSCIKDPEYILEGEYGELLAVINLTKIIYIVVIYKETLLLRNKEITEDGFIITAFDTIDKLWLFKKEILWSKHS